MWKKTDEAPIRQRTKKITLMLQTSSGEWTVRAVVVSSDDVTDADRSPTHSASAGRCFGFRRKCRKDLQRQLKQPDFQQYFTQRYSTCRGKISQKTN